MKKFYIDYTEGSGSGCDTLFDTREDALHHMSLWTAKEREGCEVVEVEVSSIRDKAKEAARKLIEDNLDEYNEWAHTSHNHTWIEAHPDGDVIQTNEADMRTRHYVDYPDTEVANILDISRCEYCDCDVCESYAQAHDSYYTDEEFAERWGCSREIVGDDFAAHLRKYDCYDSDMAGRACDAIDEIPYGYFNDEGEEDENN